MSKQPRLAIKSLRLKNFRCYEEYEINFYYEDTGVFLLYGLHGPNGSGKTTILDAISTVLGSYASYTEDRLSMAMSKYIRHFKVMSPSEQVKANFLLEADIESELGSYSVAIDRNGYLDGKEHPDEIKPTLFRQLFRTRYDEELNTFQLHLSKWPLFKKLFEAVTGYVVEKVECPMSERTVGSAGLRGRSAMLNEFVLELRITKPEEVISDRECSKGEKKVIKNFTTLLNKDTFPSVIMIDDVEMHVEIDRHMALINCIERCFPHAQVIFTTHSPKVIYNFDIERLHDLTSKTIVCDDLWRKKLIRLLGRATFFQDNEHNLECIADTMNELRSNPDMDKAFAKHVVREALFTSQNLLIEEAEKI